MSNINQLTIAQKHMFVCTNMQTIYQNGDLVKVRCGKCASCRLSKNINIVHDIQNYASKFNYCYFSTLTYAPEFLPRLTYLKWDKFVNRDGTVDTEVDFIPLPRDLNLLRKRNPHWRGAMRSMDYEDSTTVYLDADQLEKFRQAQKAPINQVYYAPYKDIQLFLKRLRDDITQSFKNAKKYSQKRRLKDPTFPIFDYTNEDTKISYFVVSEYGEKKKRPHWHLLFFFNSKFIRNFIASRVYKNWLYGITDTQLSRGQCASYVASYLQCFANYDRIFHFDSPLRPKRRSSVGFTRILLPERTSLDCYKDIATLCTDGVNMSINGSIVRRLPGWSDMCRFFPRLNQAKCQSAHDYCELFRAVSEVFSKVKSDYNPLFSACTDLNEIINDVYNYLRDNILSYIRGCVIYDYKPTLEHLYNINILTKYECLFIRYLDIYHYLSFDGKQDIHIPLSRIYRLFHSLYQCCWSWNVYSDQRLDDLALYVYKFWSERNFMQLCNTYKNIECVADDEFTEFFYNIKFNNYEQKGKSKKSTRDYQSNNYIRYIPLFAENQLREKFLYKKHKHKLSESQNFL